MKPMNVRGACRCGKTTFVLREEPIAFYLCHCTECQADSGSAFGQSMHVRREAITDVAGPTEERLLGEAGEQRITFTRCSACDTLVWAQAEDVPQVLSISAGALEDVGGMTPYGNMWTRSARPWVAMAPGPQFEQRPPEPLAMVKAWQGRPGRGED